MKYRNASEILPDELLKELQKYAPGEMLYVPSRSERKKWGDGSGAKSYYTQRNDEIREKFRRKVTLAELCDEYGLSEDTIRNICYR
jgi:hypothetical protein